MFFDFKKENILVTGASSGIGKCIAEMLVKNNANVIAVGRNIDNLNELKNKLNSPDLIHIEQKDLTENIDNIPNWIKEIVEKYGKLKSLILCAGINDIRQIMLLNQKSIDNVMITNYYSPLMIAKGFLDKRNNISTMGGNCSILAIASLASIFPDKGQLLYAASKSALVSSMKVLSQEYIKSGIRINCISPGIINTRMNDNTRKLLGDKLEQNYPLGIGETSDVAHLTLFLISDYAKWITGENYILDGGVI